MKLTFGKACRLLSVGVWLVAVVNLQVSIMKILASYPLGLASIADLRRDLTLLVASGPDWANRTKRMAATLPELDLFGAGLVVRYSFGWRLTAQGLEALESMDSGARAINLATATDVSTKVDIEERQEALSPRTEETMMDAGREAGRLIASSSPPSSTDLAAARRSQFSIIEGGRNDLRPHALPGRDFPPPAAYPASSADR
jgi:hypothetical protein